METNKKKLITHNATFHADDIFATATLSILLEDNIEIIRTRDEEIIKTGDFVYDVGGIYDEATNRFDHHQVGGAGKRENGIEYSSFGLIWKKFGTEICGSQEVADYIDKRLVMPIDAPDNGMDIVEFKYDISPYFIQDFFSSMLPTWKEKDVDLDKIFLKCVVIAKEILMREINNAKDANLARKEVISVYEKTEDKRIIVLDDSYPYGDVLSNFPEPLFVVCPRKTDDFWGVRTVRVTFKTFKNKKDLPASWAGLKDEELQKISGVPDAVFCHRALFMAVAKSKEGAVKLAQIAVQS